MKAMSDIELRPFAEDLWVAEGPIVSVAGFRYPTRMAVIRLADGGLFVWSPIALSPGLKREVLSLGQISFIVAPNTLHHLYLQEWASAFPGASLAAAPGLSEKRKDLRFDRVLDGQPDAVWSGDVDYVVFWGNLITAEVVFFHYGSRTVLFADLLQNFRPGWFPGWRGLVAPLTA